MSFKVEQLEEKNMVKLVIEASAEEFEAGLNAAYNKNKNKISVPGFRKGKAPRKMIEQLYGSQIFFEDAANEIIPDAYADAAKESGLDIVSQPKVSIEQLEAGKPFIFAAEVAVRPEVELGEYKGVEVTKADAEVTDADVEEELKKVQDQNSRTVSVEDRAVKDGDMTVIDFEGFIDGEAFEGGKGENYPLTIGSHSFIDTFEEQMIGMNIGEEKELNVTFPEDYHAENLKGKPATFKVTVKEIKEKQLPELDDDFAQDVSDFDTLAEYKDDLKKKMEEVLDKLHKLEASFDNGKLIKEGIKTAIIGKPNAGKSSLLNAILKEDRAIVTEYEGTTRDTIEEFVNINGIPLKLIDTAGIRETENEVEKIGIEKSIKYAKEADLVILIIDGSKDLSKEDIEILNIVNPKKTIIILNKIDLEQKIDENTPEIVKFNNIIKISALKKEGIDKLYEKINDLFNFNQINVDNDIVITNERHKIQIQKAIQNLNKAIKSLSINMPIDIVAIGLKDVLSDLGEITGEEASEEIINEIFARFCLGK